MSSTYIKSKRKISKNNIENNKSKTHNIKQSNQIKGDNDQNLILNLAIEVSESQTVNLKIQNDDNIQEKVEEFCLENDLGPKTKEFLFQKILDELDKAISNIYDQTSKNKPNKAKKPVYISQKEIIDRLYYKQKKIKEKRENENEKLRQLKLSKEDSELTFQPKINSTKSKDCKDNNGELVEDRLIKLGNHYKLKREKEKYDEEQNELYSFHPKIQDKSKILGEINRKKREDDLPNKKILINPQYLNLRVSKSSTNVKQKKTKFINNRNNNKYSPYCRTQNSFDNHNNDSSFVSESSVSPNKKLKTKINNKDIPLIQLNPNDNLYDLLYVEARILQEKKEKMRQKRNKILYTFKPDLSKNKDKFKFKKETSEETFNRLYRGNSREAKLIDNYDPNWNKRKSRSKNSIQSKSQSRNQSKSQSRDKNKKRIENDECTFKPKITRGPKKLNFDEPSNNSLLSEIKRKQNKIRKDKRNDNNLKKGKFTNLAGKIISSVELSNYVDMFYKLDSDLDGQISSQKICIAFIDQFTLEVITPILEELQQEQKQMGLEEFCIKAEKCFNEFNSIENVEYEEEEEENNEYDDDNNYHTNNYHNNKNYDDDEEEEED